MKPEQIQAIRKSINIKPLSKAEQIQLCDALEQAQAEIAYLKQSVADWEYCYHDMVGALGRNRDLLRKALEEIVFLASTDEIIDFPRTVLAKVKILSQQVLKGNP